MPDAAKARFEPLRRNREPFTSANAALRSPASGLPWDRSSRLTTGAMVASNLPEERRYKSSLKETTSRSSRGAPVKRPFRFKSDKAEEESKRLKIPTWRSISAKARPRASSPSCVEGVRTVMPTNVPMSIRCSLVLDRPLAAWAGRTFRAGAMAAPAARMPRVFRKARRSCI